MQAALHIADEILVTGLVTVSVESGHYAGALSQARYMRIGLRINSRLRWFVFVPLVMLDGSVLYRLVSHPLDVLTCCHHPNIVTWRAGVMGCTEYDLGEQ
jgi:hypothetical protein